MTRLRSYETMPPVAVGRQRAAPGRGLSAGGDGADAAFPPAPPDAGPDGQFEAILYPNRSLPQSGFIVVMGIVIAVNLTLGLFFFTLGAWPVLGFCGLDIFLVWLAFKISYRQGRLHERVTLTPKALWVTRVLPSGHASRWHLEPYWTQVHIDQPDAHEARLSLVSKGKRLILGSFLSPKERVAFGKRLREAMQAARATPGVPDV